MSSIPVAFVPSQVVLLEGISGIVTADGDCSHKIKRHFFLGRKAMTNLDSILKSRDITLLTKVRLAKALVFPVVMYLSRECMFLSSLSRHNKD